MAANERIGFTISADASEFARELRSVANEADRLEKISSEGGGLFASDTLRDYDQGLQRIQRSMRIMQQEYRQLSREASRFQEELDDIQKSGGVISPEQQARMSGMYGKMGSYREAMSDAGWVVSNLRSDKQDLAQTALRQRMVVGMALQQFPTLSGMYGTFHSLQGHGYNKGWSAFGAGMSGAVKWIADNVQAGMSELIDQQMGRMAVERTMGWHPRSRVGASYMRDVQGYGLGLGYSAAESLSFYNQTARATGQQAGINAASNMAMMRGYSMDLGTLLALQSTARQGGDRALGHEINKSMIRAFKAGGFSRPVMEEFVQSATTVLQTLSPGSPTARASDAANLLSTMSARLGGVYTRSPLRTANLIQRMAGAHAEGGGDAEMAFKLQAVGFGSEQGVDYVEGLRRLEEGPTAGNIQRYLRQMNQWTGGDKRMNALGLKRLYGIKMHEALSLADLNPDDLSGINERIGKLNAAPQREAALTQGRTGLVRMDLAKKQQQAALTAQYLPVIEKMWQANMLALKTTLAAGNFVINIPNLSVKARKVVIDGVQWKSGGKTKGVGALGYYEEEDMSSPPIRKKPGR